MKKFILPFLAIFCFISPNSNAQITLSGVTLPAEATISNSKTVLNGAGLREKFGWIDLYVCGLYTESKSQDFQKLLDADAVMGMRIEIVSKLVSSENMSEATLEGFGKSMKGNIEPLKKQIDSFISVFTSSEIVKGNLFELNYLPGTGTQIYKNGTLAKTIEGQDFKKALFGIWLGEDPVDNDVKKGLLGK